MSNKNTKHVYVIAAENGPVKIGISKDPDARIHTLEKQSGRLISSQYVSPPHSAARYIEKAAHSHFSGARLEGEWFDVPFEEAKAFVEQLVSASENAPPVVPVTPSEFANRMFQALLAFDCARALMVADIPIERQEGCGCLCRRPQRDRSADAGGPPPGGAG